jgi:hypothetical protein
MNHLKFCSISMNPRSSRLRLRRRLPGCRPAGLPDHRTGREPCYLLEWPPKGMSNEPPTQNLRSVLLPAKTLRHWKP